MNIENIKIEQNYLSGIEDIEQKLKDLPPIEIDSSGKLRAYMGLANIIHIEPVKGERVLGINIGGVYISHNGEGSLPLCYQDQKLELHYRPSTSNILLDK